MVQVEGSSPGGNIYGIFSAMICISVLLGLMDFSDLMILCSRPNSCCQQNLTCFDMPLLFLGFFFHERIVNKFKYVLQISAWLRPTMSNTCWQNKTLVERNRKEQKTM